MKTPSLTEALAALRPKIGEPYSGLNEALIRHLVESNAAADALKAGDKCPDFGLTSAEGALIRLEDVLARGPFVLSFYRGIWCPFCSAELEALNINEPAIREAGAQLIAVSAEAGGLSLRVKRERKFEFEILCDLDNGLSLAFGLVFRVSPGIVDVFSKNGTDFPMIYGNDSWFLPIPATYIVGRDGVIAHAYVNPDFRYRLDPAEIVAKLKGLT